MLCVWISPTLQCSAQYTSVAFSDHLSHIVTVKLPPTLLSKAVSPKSKPLFKIRPEIVKDSVFKARLSHSMEEWNQVKQFGVPILTWWEVLVKPRLRKLALERTKEINKERRKYLNLLMLRQTYLCRKVRSGEAAHLVHLREIQLKIVEWFAQEVEKVKYQSRVEWMMCSSLKR